MTRHKDICFQSFDGFQCSHPVTGISVGRIGKIFEVEYFA